MEEKEVTFVLFGGSGDLTKRKLVPAFARLVHEGIISNNSTIIGVSRKKWSDEEYKRYLVDAVNEQRDKDYINKLDIKFFTGDFTKNGLAGLNKLMLKCETEGCNRIYYLSTSFKFFPSIVKELKSNGLEKVKKGFTRIVFEKPFGSDLKSSEELDSEIHKVFSEESVFRLDHYLAKETVQNLNILKFNNPLFYSSLSNKFIDSIELIVDEDLGVGERIGFYNDTGAIKDMVQSHLLQVLSILLMEMPSRLETEKIHDEKVKILKKLEVLKAENHLLGQYRSYNEEREKAGIVNLHRETETFCKLVLNCKTKRWNGVRLILRTGKKLNRKYGQIKINYKAVDLKGNVSNLMPNKAIIDIYPKQDIIFFMNTRDANSDSLKEIKFQFTKELEFGPNTRDEYAVLLGEVIKGDKMMFARSDEVIESWKIVEKIEKMRDKIKFIYYEDGSEL
ncbi:MAG: glucose-6-phosphate dehydrogenase [Nanoarchaeota archaeon]|nr:glucose-6-phosphate dehydrogenase [Nanoarchaeota archaeon]